MTKASDILSISVGETYREIGMVLRDSGGPITAGVVNYYLHCLEGENADKWWDDTTHTWSDVEVANQMTHDADGGWIIKLTLSPFADGITYREHVRELNNLHISGAGRLLRGQLPPNPIYYVDVEEIIAVVRDTILHNRDRVILGPCEKPHSNNICQPVPRRVVSPMLPKRCS